MIPPLPQQKTTDALPALRLIRSEGVGPATFARLVGKFGDVKSALAAMPHMAKPMQPADLKIIEKEYTRLIKSGGQWLYREEQDYPELLKPVEDAPPVLGALGNVALLQKPMIAIIGARNASISGCRLARNLAGDLGHAGYGIVSGLARGIDTAAHEAALETGTIAVLANGLDVVYPPENRKLYDAIREKGALLSENPLGCQPSASLFPRRNRIISGLCRAVIVVEAEQKSGSLITIRYALDQGRDVFAIPGSPLDPRASGPNYLIKTGQAQLIESARDVLDAMEGLRNLFDPVTSPELDFALDQVEAMHPPLAGEGLTDDQARQVLLTHLSSVPCAVDNLHQITQLPMHRLLAILIELELTGQVSRLSGNRVVRV